MACVLCSISQRTSASSVNFLNLLVVADAGVGVCMMAGVRFLWNSMQMTRSTVHHHALYHTGGLIGFGWLQQNNNI